ncbi:MAG TPA: adenylate/guanylate cyclase domain-containing protein [Ktedonobacteraceae bacterium]|nr:adenylate/guanylate cyclase domain-containing protein [Ktedonobacteraceae bacterium]
MRCPNCQVINPAHAKFCMECGNRLLVCPNCSTINLPEAKFCIECGTSLLTITHSSNETIPLPEIHFQEPANPASTPTSSVAFNKRYPVQHSVRTGQLSAPEERRVVTIMFADITGSTPLADRLDPEDMRAILAGYFNLMAEQIRRHGGTVEKYIGDAVMAVFGAPVAHEDDPDRAIRAALDMQTALNRFNALRQARDAEATRLQMRIGINTGEVAAPGAQSNRQDFLITGDAVNVAARLQQVAAPDTILVGERTYLATRDVFEFRSLAPLQVKGKHLPLNVWGVQSLRSRDLAIIQHPRGIEGLQARLVGRDLELTLMHATYARVRDAHHSHLITLLGSPGIGKSRLVNEFIAREEEAARCTTCEETPALPRVLQGHCPPYGEGITYWPLVEILRSLLSVREGESGEELERRFMHFVRETLRKARRGEDVDQVANTLLLSVGRGLRGERREIQRSTLNKDVDKGGPQAALQRACRVLLEAIAQVQPLILVIDDLQWADEALLNLLEYLAGRITDFPILFLGLARPDFLERRRDWGGGQPNFTTIILDALTREETGELISELLAAPELPDVVLHTIQRRAEGNPFFVEEIVRMLIDQGVLIKEEGAWHISAQNEDMLSELASPARPPEDTLIDKHYMLSLPLPDTIQGVLAARIDLLSPIEKQVLQAASIIGRTFWVSAILELVEGLERELVLVTLEQLMQRDFLEESEKQGHGPIAAEQSFSFKHILIRDVVYNNIPRGRRSQKHAQLALWLEKQVADRLEAFAELLAYHYQQALVNWAATLHIHTINPGESGTGRDGLDGLSHVPHLTQSELVERTLRYLTLAGDRASHSYYTIRAIQAYTEALDLLQEHKADIQTIARMHQKLGHAYAQRANAEKAWDEYRQALKLLKGQPEVAREDLLSLYMHLAELATRWLGWFNTWLDTDEVREYIDEGLKLIKDQPPGGARASFLIYQAMWYIRQMKYVLPEERAELARRALQSGLEGLHIAESINHTDALWLALDALGFIYNKQHKYKEGHATQHRRQTLQDMIQEREELYDLYSSLGWTHAQINDYPTAASWFGRAWRIAQTMESPSLLLESMNGRLSVWYQWNRWDEAREVALSILQTSEQYQQDESWQLRALEVLAELAYRVGQVEEGDRLLRQYTRLFEQSTSQVALTPAISSAREDWPQALADLQEVVRRAEPFPSPSMLAHLAELSVLTGAPAAEQAALCERAANLAEQAGARKFLALAQRACGRMYLEQEQWDEAERQLRVSLESFKALDLPWEQGQTLACLGQLYQKRARNLNSAQPAARATDLELARLFFEQALGFFESLHAVRDAHHVREHMGEETQAVP